MQITKGPTNGTNNRIKSWLIEINKSYNLKII